MPRRPISRSRFPFPYSRNFIRCAACRNNIFNLQRNNNPASSNPYFAARRSVLTPHGEVTRGLVCNPRALFNVVFDNIRNRLFRHRMEALGVFCETCGVRLGDHVVVRHSVYQRPGIVISVRSGPLLVDPDCLSYGDESTSTLVDQASGIYGD